MLKSNVTSQRWLISELFSTVWTNKNGGAIVVNLFVPRKIVFTIKAFKHLFGKQYKLQMPKSIMLRKETSFNLLVTSKIFSLLYIYHIPSRVTYQNSCLEVTGALLLAKSINIF